MTCRKRTLSAALLAALLWGLGALPAAHAQWQIESKDGNTSIKLGFLAQLRAESEDTADGDTANNLFLRRFRILFGGKLSEKWSYFFETDSPNLGLSDANGNKNSGDVFIQDLFVTYSHSEAFKLDAGLILIPLSRNSTQSAATLLAPDYGPYSFLNSGPTKSRVGRDYGLQARGLVAGGKLEYRFGVYDGDRGQNASNDLRYSGRLAYNVFDPDVGMFYTGNSLGTKRHFTIGAGFDVQEDYKAYGFDVFYDQPVGTSGDAFTFQLDLIQYDGDVFFPALPEQDTLLVEVGYLFAASKLQPFLQFAQRDFSAGGLADEDRWYVGLNYRMKGHNRVARFAYGRFETDGAPDRDQIQLTLQIFSY